MSINDTSKNELPKNICDHNDLLNINKELNKSYIYCYKCNNLILIDGNKTYLAYRYMPRFMFDEEEENEIIEEKIEFDPILIVKGMIKRQDEQIREINDKLISNNSTDENNMLNNNIDEKINVSITIDNNNEEDKIDKIKEKNLQKDNSQIINLNNSMSRKGNSKYAKLIFDENIFDKYCEKRNQILIYIHKLCTKLKYNDNSFYLTLYLVDTYLSRIFQEDITEKELFLVILGFFLISSKYIEDDIFEPEFGLFSNIEKSIPLTVEEISSYEIQCLTLVNYNLYIYTVYDWLNILLNNGIIFENEIKTKKELEEINMYTQKLLTIITSKIYFCRYSSMQIAFTIVHLSREKFLNKNIKLSEKLYKILLSLYDIEFSDYEECYNEIKKDIEENNDLEEEEEENDESIHENTNSNLGSLDINMQTTNSKTLSKERNNYDWENFSRKNRFKISRDSNKGNKNIKTDINEGKNKTNKNMKKLSSSPEHANSGGKIKKYKLKNKGEEYIQNNSIGLLDNIYNNKKLSPNIMTNTNNNSLNNTSVKSCNYNQPKHLMINCNKNDQNILLNDKKLKNKNNTLYVNYAPKFMIKSNAPVINNINYINNINISNEVINLYSGINKKKIQKNISSNSNFNFNSNNDNNKNNEIKSTINHNLKKTLFKLENIVPSQLNYKYNINTINNNKFKKDNNSNNTIKVQNIITLNNKLNKNNKEKFKTHLLLDAFNNQTGNHIFKNNQIIIPTNNESKSFNKYVIKENDNMSKNKKKKLKINNGDLKIMNTNINLNTKFLKTRKMTLNFKDIVNKKIMEHQNNFLIKDNKDNAKRFNSLNSNFFDATKTNEKKFIINNENAINNDNENKNSRNNNNNIMNENNTIKDELKKFIKNKDFGKIANNIINFKNIASIKSKLPILRINKNLVFGNK